MEVEHYIDGQHNGGVYNSFNHNTYRYCYQSPVLLVDPNGKQSNFLQGMKNAIVGFATSTWESIKDWPASVGLQGNDKAVEVYTKRTEQLLSTTDKMSKAISDPGVAIDKIASDSYVQGQIVGTTAAIIGSAVVTKKVSGRLATRAAKNNIKNIASSVSRTIHQGKQGKHILGHNNYEIGKSVLKADAQELLDAFHSGNVNFARVINESKTSVDFGKTIGDYVNPETGKSISTNVGTVINSKTGAHIVPAIPN
jgi:hypothetical protein